jgi:recombinational DNA repair protein (RecF pathway)
MKASLAEPEGKSASLRQYGWVLRRFELRLLELLGYGIDLEHDTQSGVAISADKQYLFHLEKGVTEIGASVEGASVEGGGAARGGKTVASQTVVFETDASISDVFEGSGYAISGRALQALTMALQSESVEVFNEAKGLMRFVLDYYLDGRKIRSRELFKK